MLDMISEKLMEISLREIRLNLDIEPKMFM